MEQLYWNNGNLRMEGEIDRKGLVNGRLYYPSGGLHFEGKLASNSGYGPNYPLEGTIYSETGEVLFSGTFEVLRSGLGYPFIKEPKDLIFCTVFDRNRE